MKRRRKWIAKLGVELFEHRLRVEADGLRIRAKIAMSVHTVTRPATQVVVLEIDQQLAFNFGELRNLADGEMLSLASPAEVRTDAHKTALYTDSTWRRGSFRKGV